MKQITLALLIFFNLTETTAQVTQIFEGNPVWYLRNWGWTIPPQGEFSSKCYLGEKYTIDNQTCYPLLCSRFSDSTNFRLWNYVCVSGDSLFVRQAKESAPQLHMVERLDWFDYFVFPYPCTLYANYLDTIENQGYHYPITKFNRVQFAIDYSSNYIEGIGFDEFFFHQEFCHRHFISNIRCVYKNGELVYRKNDSLPCFEKQQIVIHNSSQGHGFADVQIRPNIVKANGSISIVADSKLNATVFDGLGRPVTEMTGRNVQMVLEHRGVYYIHLSRDKTHTIKVVVVQ